MKTTFLVTPENPGGWKLEDLLTEVQNDIVRRTQKIIDDLRPEARAVFHNNVEILAMLTQCIERAQESTRVVNTLGPHEEGSPRIGVL